MCKRSANHLSGRNTLEWEPSVEGRRVTSSLCTCRRDTQLLGKLWYIGWPEVVPGWKLASWHVGDIPMARHEAAPTTDMLVVICAVLLYQRPLPTSGGEWDPMRCQPPAPTIPAPPVSCLDSLVTSMQSWEDSTSHFCKAKPQGSLLMYT